jgi:hypothetical protein
MDQDQAEKNRREVLRWRILRTLNIGRPYPVAEDVLYQTVAGPDMPVTGHDVRRELDYLRVRELLTLSGQGSPQWSAKLTRAGVDVAEYAVACQPGIARPVKYW